MIIAATVAGLGIPTTDGVIGAVKVGSGVDLHYEVLFWNQSQAAWIGRPKDSMRQIDSPWGMLGSNLGQWIYPNISEGAAGIDTGYGFQIHPVNYADALCAAGLKLQEHLSAITKASASGPAGKLALNWFSLNTGDSFLSPPVTNVGVVLNTESDTNGTWKFVDTGWQNTPASVSAKKNYYPELYVRDDGFSFKDLTAKHRWVGGTIGALGGSDDTDHRPPVITNLMNWHVADTIPRAGGSAVPDWQDASGFSRHLQQSNSAKQPLLIKNVLNGHAVVRFDGVDDFLQTINATGSVSQPATIILVLKQYASGGAQQIWIEGETGNIPLLYRFNATDQIDYWLGSGSDVSYHRGTSWPSPFVCVSLVANGNSSNIWENKTVKASGDAGSLLGVGLTLGSAFDGSLPAQIDVAEVIIYYRALNDTERNSVVDYLNAKYNLF